MALTNEDLKAIAQLIEPVNLQLRGIEGKLDGVETRLDRVETRLDSMETRLDSMETRLDSMETRLDQVESDVKNIKLTLENETNKNIIRIAEGHLDLFRKLNEAIKIASDIQAKQEMQDIFLNSHETKLKAL